MHTKSSAQAVMLFGTGSNAGKSTLVAGLARALVRRGLRVMPFKPQNMSNNAAVTIDGGEIGRAQAVQALAARQAPLCDMNPVLLKPESETGAQIILQGRRWGSLRAADYPTRRRELLPAVLESFARLRAAADIVLVEGAGSPAETNLRAGDIANLGFARAAGIRGVLVGDIDRGGVIASLVGTHAVLAPEDRSVLAGFAINKFRGDPALFTPALADITARTGWPSLGVVPWCSAVARLPAEDALDLTAGSNQPGGAQSVGALTIAVPILGRIANFDDLDPLRQEPGVRLVLVAPGEPLPADAGLVILPGSKSTVADLAALRGHGWDIDLAAHVRRGGRVLGLCGGYQMLGRSIADPEGIEGPAGAVAGLGLLDIETVLTAGKVTTSAHGVHLASGAPLEGYEIHLGRTIGADTARPFVRLTDGAGERLDGAISGDGRVMGTYLHGLFSADAFRQAFLGSFGVESRRSYRASIESALDALADHLDAHFDIDALLKIAAC